MLTDLEIIDIRTKCSEGVLRIPCELLLEFGKELLAAHSAGAQGPVAIPDGWMLVKRERIEEIREYARTEFVNSYLGRNLYDERSLMRNERIGEEALSNIRDELQCIEEDEKERIAAHPQSMPQTDAARDVLTRAKKMLEGYADSYDSMSRDSTSRGGDGRISCIAVMYDIRDNMAGWCDAEIERLDRAKGE